MGTDDRPYRPPPSADRASVRGGTGSRPRTGPTPRRTSQVRSARRGRRDTVLPPRVPIWMLPSGWSDIVDGQVADDDHQPAGQGLLILIRAGSPGRSGSGGAARCLYKARRVPTDARDDQPPMKLQRQAEARRNVCDRVVHDEQRQQARRGRHPARPGSETAGKPSSAGRPPPSQILARTVRERDTAAEDPDETPRLGRSAPSRWPAGC